jgi:hypothetical protein
MFKISWFKCLYNSNIPGEFCLIQQWKNRLQVTNTFILLPLLKFKMIIYSLPWKFPERKRTRIHLHEKCLTSCYTWSVRKVSDLWPEKRNWLTWSVGHLITLKVVPLGLHTLLPAVPPLLEACRKSLFRNGV